MFKNKYNSNLNYENLSKIEEILMPNEQILWSGKPKKNAFVINQSIVMMPFALIWLLIDGGFIAAIIATGEFLAISWFIIPFFALHLLPVWIWLSNVLTAGARWKNTEYAITDKRIIIRGGLVGYDIKSIYYTEISNVSLRVGFVDKMLGVGDVHILENNIISNGKNVVLPAILDVENPEDVFKKLQKIVIDIQTDIHYPNDLRPGENHGYNTTYNG